MLDDPRKWDEWEKGREFLLMKHVGERKKLFILQRRVARFWFWQV
jgi:hypothetical protein